MIDRSKLLKDLQSLQKQLEDDLRERVEAVAEAGARTREEYDRAKAAQRTAQTFAGFVDELVTQVSAAWILSTVFVRFLEDNELVAEPRLSGPGRRRQRASDHHTLYFREHPSHSDREYLQSVFDEHARLPALGPVLGRESHNPLWLLGLSADGARALREFWQGLDPETGELAHDFRDPELGTRFLGDLYQDLSEAARKRYALLQTPDFIEEFILDRTLDPAIEEFGLEEANLIDPACGSGHFLLGAFERLYARWADREPGTPAPELAQRALDAACGVDVNPYAVAVARFRMLVAALKVCGIQRIAEAPGWKFSVTAGDSLLHSPGAQTFIAQDSWRLDHTYSVEHEGDLRAILGRRYAAVVGNPPYITPKDKALNSAYRERFSACHMKYSLGVPFTQLVFRLAEKKDGAGSAGFIGIITANSFMKREFGKKLIEECVPRWDLTHVLDTSGAYIPGHGTPTVILLGRRRAPVHESVRAVLGIRGEPATPEDPARGLVWSAIRDRVDEAGWEGEFVSVADVPRMLFGSHPWSLGGGGASALKERLEEAAPSSLGQHVESIGFASFTGLDDVFVVPHAFGVRRGFSDLCRDFVYGEAVRDWSIECGVEALTPYSDDLSASPYNRDASWGRYLWSYRTSLAGVLSFGGKTRKQCGDEWWTWYRWVPEKYRTPLSITFAFVATHNHFVLDRGGKVFNRSAPVIKLPPEATEDDHLGLLGVLNSSAACFWMKQVFYPKSGSGIGRGIQPEDWMNRFEFDGTKLQSCPLPSVLPGDRAGRLDRLGLNILRMSPSGAFSSTSPSREVMDRCARGVAAARADLIAHQEELDWHCYHLYGLLDDDLTLPHDDVPPIELGQRAFEIVLARKVASGETETQWFARHGSTPITEIPEHWPAAYRDLVQRRIDAIEADRDIALIEQPEYKRRWNTEPWEDQANRALRAWLLDRLEGRELWSTPQLTSTARLADRLRADTDFVQVAQLYRGRDVDLTRLVEVPHLPASRYKTAGLRKRAQWEAVWDLQRKEDAGDDVGEIPVPPKYKSSDFLKSTYWRLRGKLDVPKERFILYAHCERDADHSPVVGWAGWDHLQRAQAIAAYIADARERESWDPRRLIPLYAGLLDLLPWIRQWHDEPPQGEARAWADIYEQDLLRADLAELGLTEHDLREPPKEKTRRRRTKSTAKRTKRAEQKDQPPEKEPS